MLGEEWLENTGLPEFRAVAQRSVLHCIEGSFQVEVVLFEDEIVSSCSLLGKFKRELWTS
jgi:hypothetical protein